MCVNAHTCTFHCVLESSNYNAIHSIIYTRLMYGGMDRARYLSTVLFQAIRCMYSTCCTCVCTCTCMCVCSSVLIQDVYVHVQVYVHIYRETEPTYMYDRVV